MERPKKWTRCSPRYWVCVNKDRRWFVVLGVLLAAGCQGLKRTEPTSSDPSQGEVQLPVTGGFEAFLLHQGDVGVWTVECVPVFEHCGCPQVVALDDKGRCTILNSYSGKWTSWVAVQDGEWLGGVAHADVDPRRAGNELYVGGKRGNLYQVWPHPQGGFDANIIAYLPGQEIHTIAAADLDPSNSGIELLVFTYPGGLYQVRPDVERTSGFSTRLLKTLTGRVRDAVVVSGLADGVPRLATVSRDGTTQLLRFDGEKLIWTEIYRTTMGLGRIAAMPRTAGERIVLYVACDDGRIVRLEQQVGDTFRSETIFAGPQGPRGLVAGRFFADPNIESVAVFGYSKKVQLLVREGDRWRVESIFEDVDKGHWLAIGEVDGRNNTDEILLSGYGKRVVLLTRPSGYGMAASASTRKAPEPHRIDSGNSGEMSPRAR